MELFLIASGIIIAIAIFYALKKVDPRDTPGIPKPKYDGKLHNFSVEAINLGKESFEKIIRLNSDHPDQEIVTIYASCCEEGHKILKMYMDTTTRVRNIEDIEKQALYWAAWMQEYMKKTEDMRLAHNLNAA